MCAGKHRALVAEFARSSHKQIVNQVAKLVTVTAAMELLEDTERIIRAATPAPDAASAAAATAAAAAASAAAATAVAAAEPTRLMATAKPSELPSSLDLGSMEALAASPELAQLELLIRYHLAPEPFPERDRLPLERLPALEDRVLRLRPGVRLRRYDEDDVRTAGDARFVHGSLLRTSPLERREFVAIAGDAPAGGDDRGDDDDSAVQLCSSCGGRCTGGVCTDCDTLQFCEWFGEPLLFFQLQHTGLTRSLALVRYMTEARRSPQAALASCQWATRPMVLSQRAATYEIARWALGQPHSKAPSPQPWYDVVEIATLLHRAPLVPGLRHFAVRKARPMALTLVSSVPE